MSDISIPGISSKYNTNKLVEDLVAAERIRLTRMEENKVNLEEAKETWRQVNRDIGDIQRAVKSLYGFENPFSEKNAISSNERVLTADAARTAQFGEYSIVVKQVATADRFLSPPQERNFRVESGEYTFAVGDESVTLRYRGGTMADFARRISEKGRGLIQATTVRDTPNTQVLLIEAIPTGSQNRLVFSDDARQLALEIGMMQVNQVMEGRINFDKVAQTPTTATGDPAPTGSLSLTDESIILKPSSSLRLPFDTAIALKPGMLLEYSYRTLESEEDAPAVPPGPRWPTVPSAQYKDLTVRSASNAIPLPHVTMETAPLRVDDWNVLEVEGAASVMALPPITRSTEFQMVRIETDQLPDALTAIRINNGNTHRSVAFKDIRVYDPSRTGDLDPTQPVDIASDALLEFRGIDARRPTNTIDDLVDGLTINLKRSSDEPVELSVEPDTEIAKEGIIRFVFAYNQLLTRIIVLTSDDSAVIDELEYLDDNQREEMEAVLGSFRGESTLNQVKNRLQNLVSNPYPTRAEANLTLLAQMGISTNASGGSAGGLLHFSKLRGYLEIDEEKLDKALNQDISAVKDLFGNDTTGDLIINTGVAHALDTYLTSFTRSGGFVGNRINRIDGQIEDVKDEIADYEDYLDDYKADLKREYGNMEAMLNQLENSSRELDNLGSQQNGNR